MLSVLDFAIRSETTIFKRFLALLMNQGVDRPSCHEALNPFNGKPSDIRRLPKAFNA